jgi:steroid delta-isomerase-like uncharacterized protein
VATTQSRRDVASRISQAFVEAYNTGEVDRIDDVVTDDFVCHHTAAGVDIEGADGYKERIHEMREGFSDFSMSEESLIVEGEMGAGHYRWGGTHDGEFMGVPATDRTVDTTSATLMRMDGDRMAEMWVYGANAEVMEQLGIGRSR